MCTLNDLSYSGEKRSLLKNLVWRQFTGIIQCYKSSLQQETPRCLDTKENKMLGLERWPSGSECVLFLQRTQFWFPEPSSCCSQPPVMPAGGDLKPSSSLLEHLPSKRKYLEKKRTKFQLVTKAIFSFTGIVSAISNYSQLSQISNYSPHLHLKVHPGPSTFPQNVIIDWRCFLHGGAGVNSHGNPQTHFGRPLLPSPRAPIEKGLGAELTSVFLL